MCIKIQLIKLRLPRPNMRHRKPSPPVSTRFQVTPSRGAKTPPCAPTFSSLEILKTPTHGSLALLRLIKARSRGRCHGVLDSSVCSSHDMQVIYSRIHFRRQLIFDCMVEQDPYNHSITSRLRLQSCRLAAYMTHLHHR
jgi:hypothetical protein